MPIENVPAEIQNLKQDPAYLDNSNPAHDSVVSRVNAWFEKQVTGQATAAPEPNPARSWQEVKAEYERQHPETRTATEPEQPVATQPAQEATTAEASYSPLWDTPEQEALASYREVYGGGDDYQERMNADAMTVFSEFGESCIKERGNTAEARAYVEKYLGDLTRRLGNHPLNAPFLRYVAQRLSIFSSRENAFREMGR